MVNPFYFQMAGMGFVILSMVLSLVASSMVNSSYRKYSRVSTIENVSGAEIARRILATKGIHDVDVVLSSGGQLSDHYDPTKKIVALSPKVYNDSTIASVAVAAHEVGHAIQHHEAYGFIGLRNRILPAAIVSSKLAMFPIMIGLFNPNDRFFFWIGIALLGVTALFQLVTLPVEFDASFRAISIINSEGMLVESEQAGAKKMLTAAALTYVAALAATILNILRLIAVRNSSRRN